MKINDLVGATGLRIKDKKLGDELTLDDYNAFQYLLYNMTCWEDVIHLDTEESFTGDYVDYLLQPSSFLINDDNDMYKVSTDLNSSSKLVIKLGDVHELFDLFHMDFSCTMYYLTKLSDGGVDFQGKDYDELKRKSLDEEHKFTDPFQDYEKVDIPCILNGSNLEISLWNTQNNKAIFQKNDIIYRWMKIHITLNKTPWIDIRNGTANEPYEILVDNTEQLLHIIEHSPTDGTLITIRLDANQRYDIPETIEIRKGQNIEIRGGTGEYISITNNYRIGNGRAVLDGTFCKRTFIVKPGATLKLVNITLQNNNSTRHGLYDTGRGGAILVESVRKEDGVQKFGILKCEQCTFYNNKAVFGGAIFSYHAGVFLDECDFTDNYSTRNGGAIYYWANDVRLHFDNIQVLNGNNFTLKVKVTDYLARLVPEGEVEFYLKNDNNTEKYLGTVNVFESGANKGWAFLDYNLPSNNTNTFLQFIAVYRSGAIYESEVASNVVNIIFPEIYKATFTNKTEVALGETVAITVKVTDEKNKIVTKPLGTFYIGNVKYTAQKNSDYYFLSYKVPDEYEEDTIKVSFELEESAYYKFSKVEKTLTVGEPEKVVETHDITGIFLNSDTSKIVETSKGSKVYKSEAITDSLITGWENAGVTDLFVRCVDYNDPKRKATLETVLEKTKNKNFKVHAVISTFYNLDGNNTTERWGDACPANTNRRNIVLKQINNILKNTSVDGICFDYCRFRGSTTGASEKLAKKELPWNGNIAEKNRVKYVNEALKIFVDEIHKYDRQVYTSVCVMPEVTDTYGQNFADLEKLVDYLAPMLYKGNYKGVSKEQDSWVTNFLKNKMIHDNNEEHLLCILQTYSDDTELERIVEKKGNLMDACRSKTELDTTIREVAKLKIKGVCLFREGLIKEYPISYNTARGG